MDTSVKCDGPNHGNEYWTADSELAGIASQHSGELRSEEADEFVCATTRLGRAAELVAHDMQGGDGTGTPYSFAPAPTPPLQVFGGVATRMDLIHKGRINLDAVIGLLWAANLVNLFET